MPAKIWGNWKSIGEWADPFVSSLREALDLGPDYSFDYAQHPNFVRVRYQREGEEEPLVADFAPGPMTPWGQSVLASGAARGSRYQRVFGAEIYAPTERFEDIQTRTPIQALGNYMRNVWDVPGVYAEGVRGKWAHIMSEGEMSPDIGAVGSLLQFGPVHNLQAQQEMASRVTMGFGPEVRQQENVWNAVMNQALSGQDSFFSQLRGFAPYKGDDNVTRWRSLAAGLPYQRGGSLDWQVLGFGSEPEKAIKHANIAFMGGEREQAQFFRQGAGGLEQAQPDWITDMSRSGYRTLNIQLPGSQGPEQGVVFPGTAITPSTPLPGAMLGRENVLERQGIVGAFRPGDARINLNVPNIVQQLPRMKFQFGVMQGVTDEEGVTTYQKQRELQGYSIGAGETATVGYYQLPLGRGEYTQQLPIRVTAEGRPVTFTGTPKLTVPGWGTISTGEAHPGVFSPEEIAQQQASGYSDLVNMSDPLSPAYRPDIAGAVRGMFPGEVSFEGSQDVTLNIPMATNVAPSFKQGGIKMSYSAVPEVTTPGYTPRESAYITEGEQRRISQVAGDVKYQSLAFLRGGFGSLPVERQQEMMAELYRDKPDVAAYLGKIQRAQASIRSQMETGRITEAQARERWVVPSLETMATKAGFQNPWEFAQETFNKFTAMSLARPEHTLSRYAYAAVPGVQIRPGSKTFEAVNRAWSMGPDPAQQAGGYGVSEVLIPEAQRPQYFEHKGELYMKGQGRGFTMIPSIPIGPVTQEEALAYQQRAERGLTEMGATPSQRDIMSHLYKFEPIQGDPMGRSYMYQRSPFVYGTIASPPIIEEMWKGVRFGYEEMAGVNMMYPEEAKRLGLHFDQQVSATGYMPPHVQAWRTMANLYAYQSGRGEGAQMAKEDYTELTEAQMEQMYTEIQPGMNLDAIALVQQDVLGAHKGLLYNPVSKQYFPAAKTVQAISSKEVGELGESQFVNRLGRTYDRTNLEFLEGGTYAEGSLNRMERDLVQVAELSGSRTLAKLIGSRYLEQVSGGRYGSATGMGLQTMVIQQPEMEKILKGMAHAQGIDPYAKTGRGKNRMTWLQRAVGEVESAGALPVMFQREPTQGREESAVALNAMTPRMLAASGLRFEEATNITRGRVTPGNPMVTGNIGYVGMEMERVFGDVDYDPGFVVGIGKAMKGRQALDLSMSQEYRQALSEAYPQWEERQSGVLRALGGMGKSGQVPGGLMSGYVNAAVDLLGAVQDVGSEEQGFFTKTGVSEMYAEDIMQRGMGWIGMKSEMGIAYNSRRLMEAAMSSLGTFSEADIGRAHTVAGRSYVVALEQSTRQERRSFEGFLNSLVPGGAGYKQVAQDPITGEMVEGGINPIAITEPGRRFKSVGQFDTQTALQAAGSFMYDIAHQTSSPEYALAMLSRSSEEFGQLRQRYAESPLSGMDVTSREYKRGMGRFLTDVVKQEGWQLSETPAGVAMATSMAMRTEGFITGRPWKTTNPITGEKEFARDLLARNPVGFGGREIPLDELMYTDPIHQTGLLFRMMTGRGGILTAEERSLVAEMSQAGNQSPVVRWATGQMEAEKAFGAHMREVIARNVTSELVGEPTLRPSVIPQAARYTGVPLMNPAYEPQTEMDWLREARNRQIAGDVYGIHYRKPTKPEQQAGIDYEANIKPEIMARSVAEEGATRFLAPERTPTMSAKESGLGVAVRQKMDLATLLQDDQGNPYVRITDIKHGATPEDVEKKLTSQGVQSQIAAYAQTMSHFARNASPERFRNYMRDLVPQGEGETNRAYGKRLTEEANVWQKAFANRIETGIASGTGDEYEYRSFDWQDPVFGQATTAAVAMTTGWYRQEMQPGIATNIVQEMKSTMGTGGRSLWSMASDEERLRLSEAARGISQPSVPRGRPNRATFTGRGGQPPNVPPVSPAVGGVADDGGGGQQGGGGNFGFPPWMATPEGFAAAMSQAQFEANINWRGGGSLGADFTSQRKFQEGMMYLREFQQSRALQDIPASIAMGGLLSAYKEGESFLGYKYEETGRGSRIRGPRGRYASEEQFLSAMTGREEEVVGEYATQYPAEFKAQTTPMRGIIAGAVRGIPKAEAAAVLRRRGAVSATEEEEKSLEELAAGQGEYSPALTMAPMLKDKMADLGVRAPSTARGKSMIDYTSEELDRLRNAVSRVTRAEEEFLKVSKDRTSSEKDVADAMRDAKRAGVQEQLAMLRPQARAAQQEVEALRAAGGTPEEVVQAQMRASRLARQVRTQEFAEERLTPREEPPTGADWAKGARRLFGGWGLMYMGHLARMATAPFQAGYAEYQQYAEMTARQGALAFGAETSPAFVSPEMRNRTALTRAGGSVWSNLRNLSAMSAGTPMSDLGGVAMTGMTSALLAGYVSQGIAGVESLAGVSTALGAAAPGIGLAAAGAALIGTQASYAINRDQTLLSTAASQAGGGVLGMLTAGWKSIGPSVADTFQGIAPGAAGSFTAERNQLAQYVRELQAGRVPVQGTGGQILGNLPANVGQPLTQAQQLQVAQVFGMTEIPGMEALAPELKSQLALWSMQAGGVPTEQLTNIGTAMQAGVPVMEMATNIRQMAGMGQVALPSQVMTQANQIANMTEGQRAQLSQGLSLMQRLPGVMDYLRSSAQLTSVVGLPTESAMPMPNLQLPEGFQFNMGNLPENLRNLQIPTQQVPWSQMTQEQRDAVTQQFAEDQLSRIEGGPNEGMFVSAWQRYQTRRDWGLQAQAPNFEDYYREVEMTPAQRQAEQIANLVQQQQFQTTQGFLGQGAQAAPTIQTMDFLAQNYGMAGMQFANRLQGFSPTAIGELAQMVGGAQGQALSQFAVTDVNLQGQQTGLGLFTTSLGMGTIGGAQMAGQIFGANWQQNRYASAMVNGVTLPNGQRVGGMRAAQWTQMQEGFQQSQAGLGIQAAQIALQEQYLPIFWDIEDRQRALGRRQQDWGFEYQAQAMATSNRQFQENMGFQQMQTNIQRGWRVEDWAWQDQQRAQAWGWRQEDFAENVRFMTGRQRRLAERGMERETIQFNQEGERIDTQRERQKEMWRLEDERFEMSKRHQKENLDLQEENLRKQREFYEERKKLEDESTRVHREYQLKQLELQKLALGIQAEQLEKQKEYQEAMFLVNAEQDNIIGKYNLAKEKGTELANSIIDGLNWVIEHAPDALKHILDGSGGIPTYGGGGGGGGGNRIGGPQPTQEGGDLWPGKEVVVGERGPELLRLGTIGSVVNQYDLMKAGQTNRWSDTSLFTSPRGGETGSPSVVNVYIGNERLASFVIDTVRKDLEVA